MKIKQILLATQLIVSPILSFAIDYYIATSNLKVRTGAGAEYSVLFTLREGDEVEVLSKDGDWYKIYYLGKTGYAHTKYLKENRTISPKENSASGMLIILGVIAFVWLLPILIIISSSKTTSGEKVAWVLAVIFISWFAWIFYMLLAPIKKKD